MTAFAPVTLPASTMTEHEALHQALTRLEEEAGPVGEAARDVADLLRPHIRREEEFALPPLAVLPALAKGEIRPEMRAVMELGIRLQAELPAMLGEHIAIVGRLRTLKDTAAEVNRPDAEALADQLMVHAQAEEEVLYPAAILVGRYLQLVLGKQA